MQTKQVNSGAPAAPAKASRPPAKKPAEPKVQHVRNSAGNPEVKLNTVGREEIDNHEYAAVYEKKKLIGVRDLRKKPLTAKELTQVEVEKLITPAQIKNFIAKNKLDAIVIEPRSDDELTELDVMEKKTIVVRMKEIGKGNYDSIITVYRDGESKGSFDCRSVSSNPAKWVSIQEGYYWAVRHQHKGEYWALQLRSPSVRRTKVEKKTVYNKKTKKNEIVDVNVFSEEEEAMRAYSVIPIAKGELPASEDKYAVDRAIPILQDTNPLTKKDHASGINIHYGGSKVQTNSSWSMGCQLIYTPTWDDFYEIIKTRKDGTIYNMWVIR